MKKAILVGAVVVVLALVAAVVLLGTNLGRIVKAGIETFAPRFTQTTVTVESVDLSPSSGSGSVKGLVIGNPTPYTEPFAIRLGEASLVVDPASIMTDKIVVKSVRVLRPEVTIEGGLTDNNLNKLLANLSSFTAAEKSKPAEETGAKRKLQVDEFALSGTRVNVKLSIPGVGAAIPPLTLPDIRLTNLGSGSEGITPGELSQQVITEVVNNVIPAVTAQVGNLTKGATDAAKRALDKASGSLKEASKGLNSLFKR
jgi:hypothetical protein